jgi:hypothetical protein
VSNFSREGPTDFLSKSLVQDLGLTSLIILKLYYAVKDQLKKSILLGFLLKCGKVGDKTGVSGG